MCRNFPETREMSPDNIATHKINSSSSRVKQLTTSRFMQPRVTVSTFPEIALALMQGVEKPGI
jgi:hypothetical protein